MKTQIIILLFTISTSFGQTSSEKKYLNLIGKWSFEQFEEAKRENGIVKVTKTKFVENVYFEFKKNDTLVVIYSDSKKEKYIYKFERKTVVINAVNSENYNSNILGEFEINFPLTGSLLFLQRKNNPHNGIMLKK